MKTERVAGQDRIMVAGWLMKSMYDVNVDDGA